MATVWDGNITGMKMDLKAAGNIEDKVIILSDSKAAPRWLSMQEGVARHEQGTWCNWETISAADKTYMDRTTPRLGGSRHM